jgi:hypothetical protein
MRITLFLLLALACVLLAAAPLFAQPRGVGRDDQTAGKNGWVFSLEDGITQAEKTGKPLMVVFRCVP